MQVHYCISHLLLQFIEGIGDLLLPILAIAIDGIIQTLLESLLQLSKK